MVYKIGCITLCYVTHYFAYVALNYKTMFFVRAKCTSYIVSSFICPPFIPLLMYELAHILFDLRFRHRGIEEEKRLVSYAYLLHENEVMSLNLSHSIMMMLWRLYINHQVWNIWIKSSMSLYSHYCNYVDGDEQHGCHASHVNICAPKWQSHITFIMCTLTHVHTNITCNLVWAPI